MICNSCTVIRDAYIHILLFYHMGIKWPSVAYHFHKNDEITITDAIQMREGGDLRAGDIWCHSECYKAEPRTGNRLFPVNLASHPYFRRGKGSHSRKSNCEFERVMLRKGESYRFAQFYHDLLVWLKNHDDRDNPRDIFYILDIEESKSKMDDIVIIHTDSAPIDWNETRIIIVDKNRRRKVINEKSLVIDISQWTDYQLADFSNSGIRKMKDEWNQLLVKSKISTLHNAKEKRWIKNNFHYIEQARSIKLRTKAWYDYYCRHREKLQENINEGSDGQERIIVRLELDNVIREIKKRKPLLDMREIDIARRIKSAYRKKSPRIVNIGIIDYRLGDLKRTTKKIKIDENGKPRRKDIT